MTYADRRAAAARRRKVIVVGVVLMLIVGLGASLARARAAPGAASIRITPAEGPPGTTVRFSGRGYQALETVDIYEDTNLWTTAVADASGNVGPLPLKICTCFGPGTIKVKGVGESSALSAETPFVVRTNWPQFRMTPDHRAVNRFENLISVFGVDAMLELWTGPTNNFFSYSSAIAYRGTVYAGSGDTNLYAFDANGCGTQTVCPPLWTGQTGGYLDSTPGAAGPYVYVSSSDGKTYAFAAAGCGQATCPPLWTMGAAGQSVHSSPAVAGRWLIVSDSDGFVKVYDSHGCGQSTCVPLWSGDATGLVPTGSSPAVAGGRIFVGAGTSVLAFDENGCGQDVCQPLWATATGGNVFSSPAADGTTVFVGSEDDKLYALDAGTGAVLWSAPTGDLIQSSPAVAGGLVFVGSFDGGIYAFNAADGSPAWKSGTNGVVFASPAVANGVLFVQSNAGYLYAYDAAGCGSPVCSRLRRWPVAGEGSPAVSDGRVFVTGQEGSLHAIGFPGLSPAVP
jgi:outer membrane protein assembly factor BamB